MAHACACQVYGRAGARARGAIGGTYYHGAKRENGANESAQEKRFHISRLRYAGCALRLRVRRPTVDASGASA